MSVIATFLLDLNVKRVTFRVIPHSDVIVWNLCLDEIVSYQVRIVSEILKAR